MVVSSVGVEAALSSPPASEMMNTLPLAPTCASIWAEAAAPPEALSSGTPSPSAASRSTNCTPCIATGLVYETVTVKAVGSYSRLSVAATSAGGDGPRLGAGGGAGSMAVLGGSSAPASPHAVASTSTVCATSLVACASSRHAASPAASAGGDARLMVVRSCGAPCPVAGSAASAMLMPNTCPGLAEASTRKPATSAAPPETPASARGAPVAALATTN